MRLLVSFARRAACEGSRTRAAAPRVLAGLKAAQLGPPKQVSALAGFLFGCGSCLEPAYGSAESYRLSWCFWRIIQSWTL